ncbi:hypothetical protein QTP86_002857 [Hemibagrus guttatus]|nr:hypothetical protein QTP86_002857 [Hemibagrus guttatus]
MTSTAKPQSRMTSTAEPQDQATSTAEQQLRVTSTAEHSHRATSTDEQRLRGDDVRLAGVWNSPRGGRAGAGCCRNSPPLATAWRSGTVPLDWATGVVVPLFNKGDRRVCSNYRGITLLSLPGKVYSRVLERRVRPVLEGSWEFAQPVHMCFVDLEKAFDRVPRGILWEVLWEYGVRGPLLRAVRSLYNRSRSLVRIASCLDLQHALGCFAAECEAAGMRISTSKSEAMVLDRKKVACTLQVGGEVLPQVEEFKYLGVLFMSEGRMDREIDRQIGAAAAVMRSMYRSVVVKKELSRKAKLSIYQSIYAPTLTYGHELWVMTEREELGVEPLLLHIERGQLRWLGHLFRMPPGRLPGEVFRACPTGKRPRGRPRTRWRDYVFWLAWERLGVPPEELEEVAREREVIYNHGHVISVWFITKYRHSDFTTDLLIVQELGT